MNYAADKESDLMLGSKERYSSDHNKNSWVLLLMNSEFNKDNTLFFTVIDHRPLE